MYVQKYQQKQLKFAKKISMVINMHFPKHTKALVYFRKLKISESKIKYGNAFCLGTCKHAILARPHRAPTSALRACPSSCCRSWRRWSRWWAGPTFPWCSQGGPSSHSTLTNTIIESASTLRALMSVRGWSVGQVIISLTGGKLHFHASIGALVEKSVGWSVFGLFSA